MTEHQLAIADLLSPTTRFSHVGRLKPGCWGRRDEERHRDAMATRDVSEASASVFADSEMRISYLLLFVRDFAYWSQIPSTWMSLDLG